MARVDVAQLTAVQVQHALKGGDEQPLAVGLAQKLVDLGEHLPQVPAGVGDVSFIITSTPSGDLSA